MKSIKIVYAKDTDAVFWILVGQSKSFEAQNL